MTKSIHLYCANVGCPVVTATMRVPREEIVPPIIAFWCPWCVKQTLKVDAKPKRSKRERAA